MIRLGLHAKNCLAPHRNLFYDSLTYMVVLKNNGTDTNLANGSTSRE